MWAACQNRRLQEISHKRLSEIGIEIFLSLSFDSDSFFQEWTLWRIPPKLSRELLCMASHVHPPPPPPVIPYQISHASNNPATQLLKSKTSIKGEDLVRLAMDACQLEVGDPRAGWAVLDPQEGLDVEVQLLLQLLVLYHLLDVQARKCLCI